MLQRSPPFELLILDCDGVVVDSEPITMRVLTEMLNELGVSIGAEEANERFIGTTFARTLELVAELLGGALPEQFVSNYRDRTFAAMEAELKPVSGIAAALDQITIAYCIASNGPHVKMRKTLSLTSLLSRFEGRMFSSAVRKFSIAGERGKAKKGLAAGLAAWLALTIAFIVAGFALEPCLENCSQFRTPTGNARAFALILIYTVLAVVIVLRLHRYGKLSQVSAGEK